jgi:hypothetical protein
MKIKLKILFLPLFLFLFSYQGCILEDFDVIPINIPVALPFVLADDGSQNFIMSEAVFCLDSNEIYVDYAGKIKKLTLVEVAFRFDNVTPSDVVGDMEFVLKETDITGEIIIDHEINGFTPAAYLIPAYPSVLDLNQSQLEKMNGYLSAGGTCFYGNVSIANLSPQGSPKIISGFADMLFKAETEF